MFVRSLDDPELDSDDHHHLGRVLRLRDGAAITLADGGGRWRPAVLSARPEPTGPIVERRAPAAVLTVGFALVKAAKPELVVQKLTELGIDRIAVFDAERSVARWTGDKASRNLDRLRRVAREACMQARRPDLPAVDGPLAFADVVALPGAALADREGAPPDLARPTVLIGPEGGWSDAERTSLADVATIGLGDHVLRAETAAIAAATALTLLRAGLATTPG